MPTRLRSKPAVAALAISALPLPLHMAGRSTHAAGGHPTQAVLPRASARAATSSGRPTEIARAPAPRVPAETAASRSGPARAKPEATASHTWRLVVPAARTAHAARAAGDPSDTISDYQFSPGSLTIHVGETVTWINNGPSVHTATASNGSFDTGNLQKGASASHTFTQAGAFTYFCRIHPFMHGTIVVLAPSGSSSSPNGGGPATSGNGSGGNGGGSASRGTGNSSASAAQAGTSGAGRTLPMTGLDVSATLLSGVALVGMGIGIRRRSRALPRREP